MDIEGCSNLRDVEEVATRCGEWQYGEMNWWKVKKKNKKQQWQYADLQNVCRAINE